MRIGVPDDGGPLVPATPATTGRLVGLGYEVLVAAGAGAGAGFPDAAYAAAGAAVVPDAEAWAADVVVLTRAPDDLGAPGPAALRPGAVLVAQVAPAARPDLVRALADRGVTALALDAVPRISRAQSLDVLSALSNVAGYRAVVEAAAEFGGMFAGQVTAAGTTPPANVFVIGAGVAGLAAIGAAGSLGAQVRAFDVRPRWPSRSSPWAPRSSGPTTPRSRSAPTDTPPRSPPTRRPRRCAPTPSRPRPPTS